MWNSNNNITTKSAILWANISDHLACITSFKHISLKSRAPRYVKIRKSDHNSVENFVDDIRSRNIYQLLNKNLFADPNENCIILEAVIKECREKHLPARIVKYNKYKHRCSVWIEPNIIRSIQFRDKLYRRLKKTRVDSELYSKLKANLKAYNTILNRLISHAKKSYYCRKFDIL